MRMKRRVTYIVGSWSGSGMFFTGKRWMKFSNLDDLPDCAVSFDVFFTKKAAMRSYNGILAAGGTGYIEKCIHGACRPVRK